MAGELVKRGDIWMVDLGMTQKVRPCLVLSIGYLDDERALITVVARTTTPRGTQFEVPHKSPQYLAGAFDVQQIISIPRSRFMRRLSGIDSRTLTEIEAKLKVWMGLE